MTHDIRVLALDIDGVLTDGCATLGAGGQDEKRIAFHDLDAVTQARRDGLIVALVTGEDNDVVERIAGRFGVEHIEHVRRGAKDKVAALEHLSRELDVPLSAFCYVGDSDRDAPALERVGLGLAPANATMKARASAHRVLNKRGGDGVVSEVVAVLESLRLTSENRKAQEGSLRRIVEDSIAAHQRFLEESLPVISQVAGAVAQALISGRKIMLFGNGGSAADAQHVAGEIVGRFLKESEPWPAMALTTDSSILTCVGNDWAFEDVFGRQVRALARPGDVVVGISTSGKSPNVLKGLQDARGRGAITIGFTGESGAAMREHADICFLAPTALTPRIQELHLLAWHAICEIVEEQVMAAGR